MKILHVSLASPFNLEMNYQENQFINNHVKNKLNVTLVTTCYKYQGNELVKVPEENTIVNDYFRLIRLRYRFSFFNFLSQKLRMVKGLKNILIEEAPDIVYHHSLQTYEMLTIASYCKKNNVKFLLDSHQDFNNTARNFLSRYFLHKIYYKGLINTVYKNIHRIYYVSIESKYFLKKVYRLNTEKMEYLPLGGDPLSDSDYKKNRDLIRKDLNLQEKIVFIHTGKFDSKKKTLEIIQSFSEVLNSDFILLIVGSFDAETMNCARPIIKKDPRIQYLGWKTSFELNYILSASDVYLQPGSQSATMQVAACLRNALVLYPHENYKNLFKIHEVWFTEEKQDLIALFKYISLNVNVIEEMRKASYKKALKLLDNNVLTNKFLK